MGSEKFCLRWNDFESNISVAFRELREEKDFFDVTLACDDSQVQAHKVILSACSPFFRNVLRRNPHQHPLLYLKGVKYKELLSVLNFMYMGEVNVAQEELNSFLAVAEDLRVKGLTQNNSSTAGESSPKPGPNNKQDAALKHTIRPRDPPERDPVVPTPKRPRPTLAPVQQITAPNYHQEEDDIQEVVPVKSEPRDHSPHVSLPQSPSIGQPPAVFHTQQSHSVVQDQDHGTVALEDTYDESYDYGYEGYDGSGMVDPNTGMPYVDNGADKEWEQVIERLLSKEPVKNWFICLCEGCGFESIKKTNVVSHIQSKHVMGFPGFVCNVCSKHCPTTNALIRHNQRFHKKE